MGILAQRTIEYLTKNQYIDKSIQKGFMEKISGCMENTEAMNCSKMLKKKWQPNLIIVTTWPDLQNAYNTVPHNLVHYVIFPEHIRKIVFNYYNQIFFYLRENKRMDCTLNTMLHFSRAVRYLAFCFLPSSTSAWTS